MINMFPINSVTFEKVSDLLGPLDTAYRIGDRIKVNFRPNQESIEDNRYIAQISIILNKDTYLTITHYSSIFVGGCNVLEVMDVYTRMAKFIRDL